MRRTLYALRGALWAPILLAGCLCPPEAEDLLAVGFHSPEQTFRTFQTALRADLPDLEYRCLSSRFGPQIGYREARAKLFGEKPWLKLAAKAEIVETLDLDGRPRIIARVKTLFVQRTFAVDFVREGFYATYDAEGIIEGDSATWRKMARSDDGELVLRVPMPAGFALDEIGELRAGREWKIDSFELIEAPPEPTP